MIEDLLQLPWQVQLVIVSGYLSYVIAYSGYRVSHDLTDTVSIILAFGGVALISLHVLKTTLPMVTDLKADELLVTLLAAIFCVVASLTSAVLWRRFGFLIKRVLKRLSNSTEDGLPSAWHSITMLEGQRYVHLTVTLKNGRVYESYPLGSFNEALNGPCVLGTDGSIGMYVTQITEADGTERPASNTVHSEGERITFIPREEIAEIDFRRENRRPTVNQPKSE